MNKSLNIIALLGLVLPTFWCLSVQGASLEPSQAFSTALNVAESAIREKYALDKEYRVFEVTRISIGKYAEGSFGDYSVALNLFNNGDKSDVYKCEAKLSIQKVSFAKQPASIRILEQVINDYQIIAKLAGDIYLKCNR
jgi:isocitrate dehydrogenase